MYVEEPGDRTAPTEEPADILAWSDFHDCIAGLPDAYRELFDVIFYQGLEQAAAAELLGVPLRTLKRHWQQARLKLVKAMQGRMPGEVF